jgi:hypothetical protein
MLTVLLKRKVIIATGLIMLVLLLEGLPQSFADLSGPYAVDAGTSFTLGLSIIGGKLYCAYVQLSVPSGFSPSGTRRFNVPSTGMRTSLSFTAPNYATSGTFQATLFYWPNLNCQGTSYVSYAGSWTVKVQQRTKYSVSFAVVSSLHVISAYVYVRDSSGNTVGSGAGSAGCTGCSVSFTVYLPTGCYTAYGGGYLQLPYGYKFSGAIPKSFCVSGPTSVTIILLALP